MSQSHHGYQGYQFCHQTQITVVMTGYETVSSVRNVLRLKKQLSIEHMRQRGTTRWQHSDRLN